MRDEPLVHTIFQTTYTSPTHRESSNNTCLSRVKSKKIESSLESTDSKSKTEEKQATFRDCSLSRTDGVGLEFRLRDAVPARRTMVGCRLLDYVQVELIVDASLEQVVATAQALDT